MSVLFILCPALLIALGVDGHGQMLSPRSRNWISTVSEDGVNTPAAGAPPAEYCPHCLNVNDPAKGSCGESPAHDYNDWMDSTGDPMSFVAQEVFTEGEIITVSSWMDTHHNGHIEMRYCDLTTSEGIFTPDCFDGNYLTFVEDIGVYDDKGTLMDPSNPNWHRMPVDSVYPERGMLSAGQSIGSKHSFEMKFQLPLGLSGDKILLQWKYITANSCSPEGYEEYFSRNNLPDSYWTPGLADTICTRPCFDAGTCSSPFNDDGERGTYMPEQFFNCAEISVLPSSPTSSPAPSLPPATVSPTLSYKPTPSTPEPGNGCCTIDFKVCSPTVAGWCSESELNCVDACNKWWLPNGAIEGCSARWKPCTDDLDCCSPGLCVDGQCDVSSSPTPTNPTATSSPNGPNGSPTVPGGGYCDWGNGFEQPDNHFCHSNQSQCEDYCNGNWSNSNPTTPPPTHSKSPTRTPTTKSPSYFHAQKKCSNDAQVLSTVEALDEMEEITYTVSNSPYTLAVLAEGGAAGPGGSVVSEGQAYGLLAAALSLADMDSTDPLFGDVMDKFWGYYNGWKRMCKNSKPYSTCQPTKHCSGYPCLPAWMHSGDLTIVRGTGAAPDGDVDAIVAMIIGIKVLEGLDSLTQEWQDRVDEIKEWADNSCTSFMDYNTVLSSSGNHRLVKLGSCWGGWDSNGNNPSYHAPGHYRVMRDFQASLALNSGGRPSSYDWDMLIDTSYKFLSIAQCPSGYGSGLVPNWALVQESADGSILEARSGSFSGSGTPQYEFGAEASRTMWRVAFDAVAYPYEAANQAIPFLEPLNTQLVQGYSPQEHTFVFAESSLQACSPTVSNVFASWYWNGFIYGPVLSSLVVFDRQDMIDDACRKVGGFNQETYYSRSWKVLSTMTLNGAVAKAGELVRGVDSSTSTTSTTSSSTSSSVATSSTTVISTSTSTTTSTSSNTGSTTTNMPISYCEWGNGYEQPQNYYCHDSEANCEGNCNGSWVDNGSSSSSTTTSTTTTTTTLTTTTQPSSQAPTSSSPVSGPSDSCYPRASTVKLQSTTGEVIAALEVKVISNLDMNIASGGAASQSSTHKNDARFDASKAIDGDGNSFSHTDSSGTTAWWKVDLPGISSEIKSVEISNRSCGSDDATNCLCRLSDAKLLLLDSQGLVVSEVSLGNTCGQWTLDFDFADTFSCSSETPSPSPASAMTTTTTTSVASCYPSGSKVRIVSLYQQQLQMFEVQVMSSGVNIALGKTAHQSSSLKDKFAASFAVDGDSNTFSHTNDSYLAFWEVDLGGLYNIQSIRIVNRWCVDESDDRGCLCRLSHSAISIVDEDGRHVASQLLGDTCGQLVVDVAFPCQS